MTSRLAIAMASALAAAGLAVTGARAQGSGAAAHAHARAEAGQDASSGAVAAGSKSQGSYSIGLVLGSQLPKLGVDAKVLDFQQVEQGLKDVIGGKVQPAASDQQNVQQLIQQSKSGAAQTDAAGSHSLGVLLGMKLPQLGLEERAVDFPRLTQGLQDVMNGKAQASQADVQNANALLVQSRNAMAKRNEAAAQRFLAANAKRPGVKTTKSGLEYKVVSPGSGAPPRPTDQVTVNYRGTLLDGTVFDSSYARGQPFTYPLNQQMIPGWQEAVAMMKPGAKWQIFIPPELAYGSNSQPPIPPNSLLEFDIELLKVAPAAASPAGAGPNIGGATGR